MSNSARIYLTGTGLLVSAGLAVGYVMGAEGRGVFLATGAALAVQAPLGWMLVRSVRSPLFVGVWAAGILGRFGLLGSMALAVLPALGWPIFPGTVALALLLVAFLGLEFLVVWTDRTGTETE